MFLIRLWNYMRGYVNIVVESHFVEKFINICIYRGIFLWDLEKSKNNQVTLKVSAKGFKMLRPIAKKSRSKVKIVDKKGLLILINKYKARKTFAVGIILFAVLFNLLISFVWTIEINGNESIPKDVILEKLESMDIKVGKTKYGIDTKVISSNLMLEMKELAWASVSIKGTILKVEIKERVKTPELIPMNVACNVVATKDGVIKSLIVKAGQEKVKAGDTVKKGDILISGIIEPKNKDSEPKKVHAFGEVKARTWYQSTKEVQFETTEKTRTDRIKENYSLEILSKKINFFTKGIPFENYDKIETRKKASLGQSFVLPFELVVEKYYENKIVQKDITYEEALKNAESETTKEILDKLSEGVEKVSTKTDFIDHEDGTLSCDVVVECIENIGEEEGLGGN